MERDYIVPLRKEWLKTPQYKRAKKAVVALRRFLKRHMKSEDLHIGKFLNEKIWENGIRNPPGKVAIHVKKDDKGKVIAELQGKPFPKLDEEKKEKGAVGKVIDKLKGSKKEGKEDVKKESEEKIGEAIKELKEKTEKVKAEKKPVEKAEEKPAEKKAEPKAEANPMEKPAEKPAEKKEASAQPEKKE